MSLSVRDVCLQHQCCDLNQLIHSITLSNDVNVEPRLVGRRLEVLEPRLDERDLLLVDRLDERGLLARVRQPVLVPVVNTVCARETTCQRPLVFTPAGKQNKTPDRLYALGMSLNGRKVVSVRLGASGLWGVSPRQGSAWPSMIARRSAAMLNPPSLLTSVTLGHWGMEKCSPGG